VPTAEHDQLIRSSTILAPFFRLPRAYLFLTPEEEAMVANVARAALPPSAVIGSGVDPTPDRPSRAALDALGVPQDFLVYLGRVDRNKGCDALVRHYAAYVASAGAGAAPLPLVLAGRSSWSCRSSRACARWAASATTYATRCWRTRGRW
jgi:glycosyltransferase involved in cell wall biosynthesis